MSIPQDLIIGSLQYEMINYKVNPNYSWSLGDKSSENDIWTLNLSVEDWKKQLMDYEYVVIYSVNDTFIQRYNSLFEDRTTIQPNSIYKVDNNESDLKLILQ